MLPAALLPILMLQIATFVIAEAAAILIPCQEPRRDDAE